MIRNLVTLVVAVLILITFGSACTPMLKYEPPKIEHPKKIEAYQIPEDPFAKVEPPKPLFLCKTSGGISAGEEKPFYAYKECDRNEATIIAYIPKEHDKIVLRLSYYKELVPALTRLINVYIEIANVKGDLIYDHMTAKEVYKQMWVDVENRRTMEADRALLEKVGLITLTLGQLAAILALAL